MVLNTMNLIIEGVHFTVIRLEPYERKLKEYRRLEPRLDAAVETALRDELCGGQIAEIPGAGGWSKARIPSPSRNIGKSGGFRLIFLFLRVAGHVFIYTVYDHRSKSDLTPSERSELNVLAGKIKKSLGSR